MQRITAHASPSYIPMISISFFFVKMKGNVDLRSVNFESA